MKKAENFLFFLRIWFHNGYYSVFFFVGNRPTLWDKMRLAIGEGLARAFEKVCPFTDLTHKTGDDLCIIDNQLYATALSSS